MSRKCCTTFIRQNVICVSMSRHMLYILLVQISAFYESYKFHVYFSFAVDKSFFVLLPLYIFLSCKNNHFIQTFSYSTLQFWKRKSTYIRTRNSYKLFSGYLPKLGYYYYSSIRNMILCYMFLILELSLKMICSKILAFKELGASIYHWTIINPTTDIWIMIKEVHY